jgi:hypothetical protein
LIFAGLCAPEFLHVYGYHYGAFRYCIDGSGCSNISSSGLTDKFRAFQAFLLLSFFASVATCAGMWILLTWRAYGSQSRFQLYLLAMGLVTAVFELIDFSLFASDNPSNQGASFGLLVSSWVFGLILIFVYYIIDQYETTGSFSFDVNALFTNVQRQDKSSNQGPPAANKGVEQAAVVPGGNYNQGYANVPQTTHVQPGGYHNQPNTNNVVSPGESGLRTVPI